ncbi:MAG: hypothetical protein OHK0017_07140 [Patescibacteria group bacterium]
MPVNTQSKQTTNQITSSSLRSDSALRNPLMWSVVVILVLVSLSVGIVVYGEMQKSERDIAKIVNGLKQPTELGVVIDDNNLNYTLSATTSEPDTSLQTAKSEVDKKINSIQLAEKKKVLSAAQKVTQPVVTKEPAPVQTVAAVEESYKLDIPYFRQIYKLSCEAASLQMALAYRGVNVSQDELLSQFGNANPFAKEVQADGTTVWGDPNLGFVGDVKSNFWGSDGKIESGQGWGINNGPVARVANIYRPGSEEVDGGNVEQLKAALREGKPVIFWHQRDDARKDFFEYTTPEGKKMRAFQNHVNILTGYSTSGSTTYFYFNDPFYSPGRIKITESAMKRWWARYNNDAVIIN